MPPPANTMTFSAAETHCQDNHGGVVAMPKSPEEMRAAYRTAFFSNEG